MLVRPGSLKTWLGIWLYSGVLVVTHVIYSISDFAEIFTEPGTWKNMWRAGEKAFNKSWIDLKK